MTLKRSPQTFGALIVRIASSFSLLLLVSGLSWGQEYRELHDRVRKASTAQEIVRAIRESGLADEEFDSVLHARVEEIAAQQNSSPESIKALRDLVELRALAERAPAGKPEAIQEQAREIKSSPLYRDPGEQDSSNWLEKALRRIENLFSDRELPDADIAPGLALPKWLGPAMWAVLGAAVAVFIYFVVRHFSWKRGLTRKARAIIEEDEPDRTLDEWLALADSLTAEGRYREAVRALYLSCLMKFDEHNVARFVRGETNWEHLQRIQASKRKPPSLDFLTPTKAFDRIWYGRHVRGLIDVEEFRAWYSEITSALKETKVA